MKKKDRALEAIRANPQKSNRAIADEIGVSKDTVRRARATGDQALVAERHIGLDGKNYSARTRRNKRTESLRSVFTELSGLSVRQFAVELNARNVPTPAGGKWHATQVIRMRNRLGMDGNPALIRP